MKRIGRILLSVVSCVPAGTTLVSCSASSLPASPSLAPASAPSSATISGTLSATNGGERLASVSIAASTETVTTDAAGAFELHLGDTSPSVPIVIRGPSIVTRTTTLGSSARSGVALSAFRQDGAFDLAFYRAFARNGYEQPSQLQPIRRWTQAPQIYVRTVDQAGQAIDAVTLETVAAALADSTGGWTGDRFKLAGLGKGPETREGVPGWITVKWTNPPAAGRCGLSQVGTDGGWIELNYLGASCDCGGPSRIYPRLVRHELGHALGYYHTDSPGDVMYGRSIAANACNLHPSAREIEYAKYVYSRPVGNTDPDNDPVTSQSSLRSLPILIQP